jgi:hypothetical protein
MPAKSSIIPNPPSAALNLSWPFHPVCLIDLFFLDIYCFTSRSRIFHLHVTIAGEGLQNVGLCSALTAFKQGGIFIELHLLWHGTSVFPVPSEGPSHSVASYDTHGDAEDLLTLTRIVTGCMSLMLRWTMRNLMTDMADPPDHAISAFYKWKLKLPMSLNCITTQVYDILNCRRNVTIQNMHINTSKILSPLLMQLIVK